jgi:hypothetical protein
MGARIYAILLAFGLVLPSITITFSLSFNWFDSVLPRYSPIWFLAIITFEILSFAVSPVSVYLYCTQVGGIRRTRNKVALVSFETILYFLTIVVPSVVFLGFPQIVTLLLFCAPPFLALFVGLGLKRIESKPYWST